MIDVQEEWSLKHKDKGSAASMERVQHFGEAFAKIQEATGALHCALLPASSQNPLSAVGACCFCPLPSFGAYCWCPWSHLEVNCFCPVSPFSAHHFCPLPLLMPVVSALSLSLPVVSALFLCWCLLHFFPYHAQLQSFLFSECSVTAASMSSSSSVLSCLSSCYSDRCMQALQQHRRHLPSLSSRTCLPSSFVFLQCTHEVFLLTTHEVQCEVHEGHQCQHDFFPPPPRMSQPSSPFFSEWEVHADIKDTDATMTSSSSQTCSNIISLLLLMVWDACRHEGH